MDFDGQQRERQEERQRDLGDRSFTLRGETFTYKASVGYDVLRQVSKLGSDTAGNDLIDVLEDAVLDMIENSDGSHERFRALRQNTDFPVTFFDLNDVATWLIQQQVGRPTPAPSLSGDGRSTTGTSSTDGSSSPQDVASTS